MNEHPVEALLEHMTTFGDQPALYHNGEYLTYSAFVERVDQWAEELAKQGVGVGTVCGFMGDFSLATCSLYFALLKARAVLVPFSPSVEPELENFLGVASVDILFRFDADDNWTVQRFENPPKTDLMEKFKERQHPGLVLFSSGSTGGAKGILHDCIPLLQKFLVPRPGRKSVLFLLIDHIGGFNTMLANFAFGGLGVCTSARTPESVCRVIHETQAELLPTTPTFLNLMYGSRTWEKFDLDSLTMITYGTEVMSDATLQNVGEMFPNATLKQTYGLSELGILRSQSESSDSAWVRIGGEGYETKVVDNILWIRAQSNMVGYLNAPNPFDEDGWMCTQDVVEVKDGKFRFKGRDSELINVGGQKVHPIEVEEVLLNADNISEATVYGQSHPVLGNVPVARVAITEEEEAADLTKRLRKVCREQLAKHKIPMKFTIANQDDFRNDRFKKIRKLGD